MTIYLPSRFESSISARILAVSKIVKSVIPLLPATSIPNGSAHFVKPLFAKICLSAAETVWALLHAITLTFALSVAFAVINKLEKNEFFLIIYKVVYSKSNSNDIIFRNDLLSSLVVVIVVAVVVVEAVVSGPFLVLDLSAVVFVFEDVLSDLGKVDVAVKQIELR